MPNFIAEYRILCGGRRLKNARVRDVTAEKIIFNEKKYLAGEGYSRWTSCIDRRNRLGDGSADGRLVAQRIIVVKDVCGRCELCELFLHTAIHGIQG